MMLAHFLAMGGYAAYVWPAYAVTAIGIGGAVALTLREYRRARRSLRAIESETDKGL